MADFRRSSPVYRRLAPSLEVAEVDSTSGVDIKKAVFSTSDVALDGHKILNGAWQSRDHDGLADFIQQGSPLLWAHDDRALPVGNVVGIRVVGGDLVGGVKFNSTPTGAALRDLYSSGSMRSFSVSWIPLEYRYASGSGRAPGSMDFAKTKLLEISAVTLPADSGALVQERSAQRGRAKPQRVEAPRSPLSQLIAAAQQYAQELKADTCRTPAEKEFYAKRATANYEQHAARLGAPPHVFRIIARIFDLGPEIWNVQRRNGGWR